MCIAILAYLIKDILELVLRQRRALDVLDGTELSRHSLAVFLLYRGHPLLRQLVFYCVVFPQIYLCTDDEARHAWAVVVYFGKPFLADVLERSG